MQVPDAKAVAVGLATSVNALLMAKAAALVEAGRIIPIQQEVLNSRVYLDSLDTVGKRITDPKNYWLMSDADCLEYSATLHERYVAMGYVLDEVGRCPLLMAEWLVTLAERALVDAAQEFFPDVTNDRLLCQAKGLERRAEYIELLIKLVVNYPGYKKPKLKAG